MFLIKDAFAAEDIKLGSNTSTIDPSSVGEAPKQSMEQSLMSFLPLIVIFVIFYFMLIRPQAKKQKQHQSLLESVKKGDKVVLSSGIIGSIVKVEDDKNYVQVEIAQNVKVRMLRNYIADIFKDDKNKELKEVKPEEKEESKE